MALNKNTAYTLLNILNGQTNATAVSEQLPAVTVRSIQRALVRLHDAGLVKKSGNSNNPEYTIQYPPVLAQAIPEKLLEEADRPNTKFNQNLLEWLENLDLPALNALFGESHREASKLIPGAATRMSLKELEHLTIELSWKSSALEGNTYTLLDTQLLLTEGIKAKNRTEFETQMILNHKNAIGFIMNNGELFSGTISFGSVEELHRIIGHNLGIDSGIRKKPVRITASNYVPVANPHQLREFIDRILAVVSRATDPYARALLALALVPYLQVFEDGNKRTGRLLANAILIHSIGHGFSLRKTDARSLALAYLAFYEFNSVHSLNGILRNELPIEAQL